MKESLPSDENNILGYSHRVIIIRALVHTALWWPCWWLSQWILGLGIYGLGASLAKLIFYTNNLFMAMFWYLIYSIAKRVTPTNRDIVKYLFFWLIIHIIMELPFMLAPN